MESTGRNSCRVPIHPQSLNSWLMLPPGMKCQPTALLLLLSSGGYAAFLYPSPFPNQILAWRLEFKALKRLYPPRPEKGLYPRQQPFSPGFLRGICFLVFASFMYCDMPISTAQARCPWPALQAPSRLHFLCLRPAQVSTQLPPRVRSYGVPY